MGQGRQAKILTPEQIKSIVHYLARNSRQSRRDIVIFLLSVRAGLRAKEIASLRWEYVTDAEGVVGEEINLPDVACKGKSGRTIPLNAELREALVTLKSRLEKQHTVEPQDYVIKSERAERMCDKSVVLWFRSLYQRLGYSGCSSHSGRRTAITMWARKVSEVGGSLRDVQQMAGHSTLQVTQRYVEGSSEAKRKLVNLV